MIKYSKLFTIVIIMITAISISTVVFASSTDGLVTDPGASKVVQATTSGRTLLYTGANYVAYVLASVIIVAIAVVVKRRT